MAEKVEERRRVERDGGFKGSGRSIMSDERGEKEEAKIVGRKEIG